MWGEGGTHLGPSVRPSVRPSATLGKWNGRKIWNGMSRATCTRSRAKSLNGSDDGYKERTAGRTGWESGSCLCRSFSVRSKRSRLTRGAFAAGPLGARSVPCFASPPSGTNKYNENKHFRERYRFCLTAEETLVDSYGKSKNVADRA